MRLRRHIGQGLTVAALIVLLIVGLMPSTASADEGSRRSDTTAGQQKKQDQQAESRPEKSERRGSSDHSQGNAGTSGSYDEPQPYSNADQNNTGANNTSSDNPYRSTRDGSPSENGNGDGNATGKPCAGCVGKADNKDPSGQAPNGSDHNAGYECDRNNGVGKTNPAHTGCTEQSPPPPPPCNKPCEPNPPCKVKCEHEPPCPSKCDKTPPPPPPSSDCPVGMNGASFCGAAVLASAVQAPPVAAAISVPAPQLAVTGLSFDPLLTASLGLIGLGTLFVIASRRRTAKL